MAVGHDLVRDHPSALDRLPEEGLRTGRVAVLADQDVDDHAGFVERTVEVRSVPLAAEEHLVDEPTRPDRTLLAPDLGRQLRPEGSGPVEHGAMRDVDAALGQQLEHLPAGQRVGQVPTHAVRITSAGQR